MGKRRSNKPRKSKQRQHERYDVEEIKYAAASRGWSSIFSQLAGIDPSILNGNHHPCPKCGGTDRFRAIDISQGALLCNQCFTGHGDGLAALVWLNNWTFTRTIIALAELLGIKPDGGGVNQGKGPASKKPGTNADGKSQIAWLPSALRPLFLVDFCRAKPPITPATLIAARARVAQWPAAAPPQHQADVICLPVVRPGDLTSGNLTKAAGAALYRRDGQQFDPIPPKGNKSGLPARKIHLLRGTDCGYILVHTPEEIAAAHTIIKFEGPTDLLAAVPMLPPGVVAFTTTHGAKVFPAELAMITAGKQLIILHDADQPGEDGATSSAKACAGVAGSVLRCRLPYPIQNEHGRDFRDWLLDASPESPRTWDDLLSLVDVTEQQSLPAAISSATGESASTTSIASQPAAGPQFDVEEAPDDPHRLARICANRWDQVAYYQDEWYIGTLTSGWRVIPEPELRAHIITGIKAEFDAINRLEREAAANDGEPLPLCRKVTGHVVTNAISALRALYLISGNIPPNAMLADTNTAALPLGNQEEGAAESENPFAGIEPGPKDWIAVKNGILCLDRLFSDDPSESENCLLPHTLNWWSTVRLTYDFDPEADCPKWKSFLNRSLEGDAERISLLQEWAGYLLLPNTDSQKFLVLEGEGGNGKSVFLAAMQALLGSDQVSNVQLEIFGQRFALTNSLGKLANISADVGEIDKLSEGYLKSYTSGDSMFFDRKGISGINTRPTARLMISVNNRPRLSDRSSGVWRRMLLVPWNVQISSTERIKGMDKHEWWEAQGELPGILNWAIAGLHRLRSNGDFTLPKVSDDAMENYKNDTNPAREFLLDHFEYDPDAVKQSEDVYKNYREWCKQNGYHPLAANTFGKEVSRAFKRVTRKQATMNSMRTWAYFGLATKSQPEDDFLSS